MAVDTKTTETGAGPTSADVLLANRLYYAVEAQEYDQKNHVRNPAILRYYNRLLTRFVFGNRPAAEVRGWRVCDVGCGTGFLETLLTDKVGPLVAFDATEEMLLRARSKNRGARVSWIRADAQALPVRDEAFDLVCSNAMLHHVFGYEQVVTKMVAMLKPGGKLFLGYEPNAIPYRLFWPLLKVAARMVPEHRHRDSIRDASNQAAHPRLQDVDIHELAEFHIFHGTQGRGIDPHRLEALVSDLGIRDCRLHFSSVYQFALLRDSGVPVPLGLMPDWFFRLSGRLSLSFSLTGTKRS